jgi:DNA polymerase-3 subunit delta
LFVYGSDDFLVNRRARILYDTYCDGGEIFSWEQKFDARLFIGRVCEAMNTVPMFAPTHDLWIRGVGFFSGAESEETKACFISLLDVIKSMKGGVVLISACPVDRRTELFKEFSQLAECHDVTDIGDKNCAAFIREVCENIGVGISNAAVDLLQNLVGKDTRLIQLELEKLANYIYQDHDVITRDDVSLLVDPANGGDFFQQIENFYLADMDAKLDSIERYFFFVNEARLLLGGLQNRTRLMIQLRALLDSGKIQMGRSVTKNQLDNLSKLFNIKNIAKNSCNIFSQNPWYLSKLLESVNRYSLPRLLGIQVAIMEALAETANHYDDQIAVMKELALKF